MMQKFVNFNEIEDPCQNCDYSFINPETDWIDCNYEGDLTCKEVIKKSIKFIEYI